MTLLDLRPDDTGHAVRSVIDRLPPIGLDDLVTRAELLTRVDAKYLLPVTDLPDVLRDLADSGTARVLQIDGCRTFRYRSVYFDTPDLASFHAAARTRRHRYKVRVRSYLDTDLHVVEVKTRGRRGVTVKQRIPYPSTGLAATPTLSDGAVRAWVDAQLAAAGFHSAGLRFDPVLTTTYQRITLFLPLVGSRMTVDTGLTWSLPAGAGPALWRELRLPHRAVVETKSPRAACAVDRLLWSAGHRPRAISKYATGLAALRPDLPANRWRPTLRRLLTDGPDPREFR
ncbi:MULTISPECIES: polyphosphate polymerase domain-containing protein [unclassified Solwaraspora]|uniref:polyphosphate polymerase domain-containing protein n=1 Tax=unclassified Solwaraspora TaxID=2627926 RepID=UPI00259BDF2B|nr:polyphosphate polymerase domain-containing protein [Solwaraspora sp. WMMA2056]WJK41121.1 polyphosphate polymerase domain-containing protein [Solwaraspora sp. WMMA2056]